MIAKRYSLDREIGRGGMGAVWLGRDEILGRPVAIKRIGRAPGAAEDPESDHRRAEREARIAASLSHPHVVAVFDLVEDDDDQWLVMEYVEGRSLAQTVRDDGPLDHDRAGAVLADAAGALATAHAEGIVHRDVKPSNILLTTAGEAKLLDFGIARAQGDLTLTQTGLVSGSPAYLAPEVASGMAATTASDVWSLGATLFHLLTGRPPYDVSGNVVGGLYRIVHEEPPQVDDSGWLGPLLASTMVRDPAHRWSMAHVASFLDAGPQGSGSSAGGAGGAGGAAAAGAAGGLAAAGALDDDRTRRTTALTSSQQPTVAQPAVPQTAAPPPAEPTEPVRPVAEADPDPAGRSRRRGLAALVAVVVVLVAAIALFALQPDEQQGAPEAQPPSAPAGSGSSGPTDDGSPSAELSPSATPDADAMSSFIESYLPTAASDPAAGFAMLSPSFKAASGGLSGYEGFWGRVESVSDIQISEVDPQALTVRYTYSYRTTEGEQITDDVSLQLSYDAAQDRYLIADEA